jgi:hypothetical protein
VVETIHKKQTAYVCVADAQCFEIFSGKVEHEIKSMETILRVEDA